MKYIKILIAAVVGAAFFLAGSSIACRLAQLNCGGETIGEKF